MTNDEIIEILEGSIRYREKDIMERQIDIDNHRMSLKILDEEYGDDPDLVAFRPQLEDLLRSAVLEQNKVRIFLEAARANLAQYKNV